MCTGKIDILGINTRVITGLRVQNQKKVHRILSQECPIFYYTQTPSKDLRLIWTSWETVPLTMAPLRPGVKPRWYFVTLVPRQVSPRFLPSISSRVTFVIFRCPVSQSFVQIPVPEPVSPCPLLPFTGRSIPDSVYKTARPTLVTLVRPRKGCPRL